MPRAYAQANPGRRTLPAAVLLLCALSALPPSWNQWAEWSSELAGRLVGAISHPLMYASRAVAPARGSGAGEPEEINRLIDERNRFETLWQQQRERVVRLEGLIEELQRGIALNPDLRVRQVRAAVIARSSDLSSAMLTVRAGRASGIDAGSVVVVRGVQLVGRVESVGARTSRVRPVTDRGAGSVRGRISATPDGRGPVCLLSPTGRGTLAGDVADVSTDPELSAFTIQPGMEVRLLDETWPDNAQMLVIGVVERVSTDPSNPLRTVVTVRPTVEIERVSELTIRATLAPDDDAGVRNGSGGGW